MYYGKYYTNAARTSALTPVKYRVLNKYETKFIDGTTGKNTPTLFLDCDKMLYTSPFDRSEDLSDYQEKRTQRQHYFKAEIKAPWDDWVTNNWEECTTRDYLNGYNLTWKITKVNTNSVFYKREGVFSSAEKAAIILSKMDKPSSQSSDPTMVPTGLVRGDHIFLLDITDVESKDYGYGSKGSRKKVFSPFVSDKNFPPQWWLRTPNPNNEKKQAVLVNNEGKCVFENIPNAQIGASPAFNVKLSSVVFTSLVSGDAEQPGAEYKLTLLDASMDITPDIVTPNGNTVTVSYTITENHDENAKNATHVSVLVTDGEWTENGWTVGEVKYYKQFAITNNNKSVSFDLPGNYDVSSWKTYILAESVATGEYAANTTDYASAPVELFPVESVTLNKGNLEFTIGGTTLTETLTATVSPDNALNKSVTWSTSDTNVATVTDSGEVTGVGAGTAVIKVMSAVNSKISADCTVKVNKGTPKVTKAPAANNRTYDGTTQPLVTAGKASGGTMVYATGTDTKHTAWNEKIPTGTIAATYHVWYMVSGDVNHKDTDAQTVTVYITKPVVTPTESGGSDNSDTDGKTEKQKSGDSTTTGGNNSGSGSGNGSSNTGGKAEEQKSGDSSATDGSSNGSDSSNNGQKVTVGYEKANEEVAKIVKEKITELLPGLPDDVEFFSDPDNMEFKGVNGLTSYIEKIIDELKGTVRELTAVMSPVSVKTAGVYFVKVNVTEEQSKELIGTRNLAYHIELYLENKEEAQVRIADAGEGESDVPTGKFVDENGDVVSGAYGGGDIYLLVYVPKADTTYVQYMTAEADQKPLEETTGNSSSPTSDSTSPSGYSGPTSNKGPGGCDAGFGGLAGLIILPLLARRRKK